MEIQDKAKHISIRGLAVNGSKNLSGYPLKEHHVTFLQEVSSKGDLQCTTGHISSANLQGDNFGTAFNVSSWTRYSLK